ncbi:hypothetical protein Q5692_37940, partial [Microcoleus sp. C2C3]|uniref:hypothetical protein n=1 Tax=unclassified Microcoleus TaxID=2642155 RepID=UPI002FD1758A
HFNSYLDLHPSLYTFEDLQIICDRYRWCHEVLALLQSVLYLRHNQGMQSPRKLSPCDSSNPNNRLRMSIDSREMGRSILLSFSTAPSIALIPCL